MSSDICVVVGVGPGIGLAVARRFAREGFRLALLARQQTALEGYAATIAGAGGEAYGFSADASDPASLIAAFEQIRSQIGDPAVLVYNASASHAGPPSGLPLTMLQANFAVNVGGALTCAQQVIPAMRAQGRGTILLTGGGLALTPSPQYASLSIGKAGMRSLAYSLADELQPEGIHVATVTVAGFVQPGSHFDPDTIAEVYWTLHCQPIGDWEREIIYQ